jgi:hypothetical protein
MVTNRSRTHHLTTYLLLAILIIAFSDSIGAPVTAAQTAPASVSLTGTWKMMVGKQPETMTIEQEGNKIIGTMNKGWPVEGTVDGKKVHFTAKRSDDGVVEDFTGTLEPSGQLLGERNDSDRRVGGMHWHAGR